MAKEINLMFLVDDEEEIIYISKSAIKNIKNFSSMVENGYFLLKSKFPNFKEVIVPTLGTIIED